MALEEILQKVKDTIPSDRPLINYNGVVDRMTDDQYTEYLQAMEELKNLPPIPPTADERLDKMEPTLETMQKGLADLGNLIGKLMRGGLK